MDVIAQICDDAYPKQMEAHPSFKKKKKLK